MSERVSVIRGKKPIILVAPHGGDDPSTAIMAEIASSEINGWAVINRGFKRNSTVNVFEDKASCHRIDHITQPVVEDEFLLPLDRIVQKYVKMFSKNQNYYWTSSIKERVLVYYIYNCSDQVHEITADNVGVILGYGKGDPKDSLTCKTWRKSLFAKLYEQYDSGNVYEGRPGGKFAGRGRNNILQYYQMFSQNTLVECMQLAFPYSRMTTTGNAMMSGMVLGAVLEEMIKHKKFKDINYPRFI